MGKTGNLRPYNQLLIFGVVAEMPFSEKLSFQRTNVSIQWL